MEGFLSLFRVDLSVTDKPLTHERIESQRSEDLTYVHWDEQDHQPVFVEFGFGRPNRKYLTDDGFAKVLQEMDLLFPQDRIYPLQRLKTEILLVVRGETHPDIYYVYDQKAQTVTKLLGKTEHVPTAALVESIPFEFKAKDGLPIAGYLYRPVGTKGAGPMILNIHGGPFGIAEQWRYAPYDQFLVSHGYSVLRVNYRGSGGKGLRFEEAGYGKLGTAMQSDLADAAQWAIAHAYAKPGQIGLWGGSYGGYAAIKSILLHPELFQCAASFGGVYDWEKLTNENDCSHSELCRSLLERELPPNPQEMAKQSVILHASDAKRDLMIAHGVDDRRVPIDQARRLKAALTKLGKNFLYREYPDTGHWITNPTVKQSYFDELVKFLDAHLKK